MIGIANLGELAARAKARERERRIGTRRKHQAQVRRQVIDEELHQPMDGLRDPTTW
ncbi:MAG TPA: hypothetical protein VNA69_03480 [Thermoanaerobaculia bacterium]|nr:hypothetical protein [Thermoanaerobaculia bacterium]